MGRFVRKILFVVIVLLTMFFTTPFSTMAFTAGKPITPGIPLSPGQPIDSGKPIQPGDPLRETPLNRGTQILEIISGVMEIKVSTEIINKMAHQLTVLPLPL